MTDLRELYLQVLLEHSRSPRNFGKLADANYRAEGRNPLCGDELTVYIDVEDGKVRDIAFVGTGCAISKASASIMTQAVKGRTLEEARSLFDDFQQMVTSRVGEEVETEPLGKLAVFLGVREFPVRVKCATLPWHTLNAALEGEKEPASTE